MMKEVRPLSPGSSAPISPLVPASSGYGAVYCTNNNSVMVTKPVFVDIGLDAVLQRSQFYVNQLTEEDYQVLSKPIRPLVPIHSRSKVPFEESMQSPKLLTSRSNQLLGSLSGDSYDYHSHKSLSSYDSLAIFDEPELTALVDSKRVDAPSGSSIALIDTGYFDVPSSKQSWTGASTDLTNAASPKGSRSAISVPTSFRPSKILSVDDIIKSPNYDNVLKNLACSAYFSPNLRVEDLDTAIRKRLDPSSTTNLSIPGIPAEVMTDLIDFVAFEIELAQGIESHLNSEVSTAYIEFGKKAQEHLSTLTAAEARATDFHEKLAVTKSKIRELYEAKRAATVEGNLIKSAKNEQAMQRLLENRSRKALAKAEKESNTLRGIKDAEAVRQEHLEKHLLEKHSRFINNLTARQESRNQKLLEQSKSKNDLIAERQHVSADTDQAFRIRAATAVANKDAAFKRRQQQLESERELHFQEIKDRELRLGFQAEQRRRAIETSKRAAAAALAIRDDKFKLTQFNKRVVEGSIPHAIHEVKRAYDARPESAIPLNPTPGPGDYSPRLPNSLRGGSMGKGVYAGAFDNLSKSPGPGQYSPNYIGHQAGGAIPFMGRGKDDVDWKILTAKQLPGPGYYDLGSSKPKGTLSTKETFNSRGKTDLDWKIINAKTLPGPGYYDIDFKPTVVPTLTRLSAAEIRLGVTSPSASLRSLPH